MTEPVKPVPEPAAQAFADAGSAPPVLVQLPPEEGRKIVGLNPLTSCLRGVLGTG